MNVDILMRSIKVVLPVKINNFNTSFCPLFEQNLNLGFCAKEPKKLTRENFEQSLTSFETTSCVPLQSRWLYLLSNWFNA